MTAPRAALYALLLLPLCAYGAPHKPHDVAIDQDGERLELARDHFQQGQALEAQGKLDEALVEYELAEAAHPSPSIAEAKQKVHAMLEARRVAPAPVVIAAAPAPIPPPQHAPLRRFIAPIVLAPIAFGSLVAGGALLATVRHDTSHFMSTCSPACAPSDVHPLTVREPAAYALLGVGAGLALVDAALWVALALRPERPPTQASIEPSLMGLKGRF